VANLPYNVASRIALRFLAWDRLRDAVFMFQREVALRLAASPGNRQYGGLTVMARVWSDPYALFPVPPGAFRPRPKVDSHVVRFRCLDQPRVTSEQQRQFEAVVRGVFQTRRKTVINSLIAMMGRDADSDQLRAALDDCSILPTRRAETLSFDDFAALAVRLR
jgi:16S rRNA (adenine1518-N6/adenine1519-N6)-dimethyltransferase